MIKLDWLRLNRVGETYSAYLSFSGDNPDTFHAPLIVSACPRGEGTWYPAFSRAPSEPMFVPKILAYMGVPSSSAAEYRFSTTAVTASAGTVPSARASNGLHSPRVEKIWPFPVIYPPLAQVVSIRDHQMVFRDLLVKLNRDTAHESHVTSTQTDCIKGLR